MKTLFILLISLLFFSKARATIWTVDDDGTAQFIKIQDAIDAASYGDTVYVLNGVYPESIALTPGISIIGENNDSTFVLGTIEENNIIEIEIGCTVKGLNILASNNNINIVNGIAFGISSLTPDTFDIKIRNNKIVKCDHGIIILSNNSANKYLITIENNIIQNNNIGIDLFYIDSIEIANNLIFNNSTGINIQESPFWRYDWDIRIYGNDIENNDNGINLCGGRVTKSSNSPVTTIFDATRNWWGTTIDSEIQNTICDWEDRKVDYNNWLYAGVETPIERQDNGIHRNNILNNNQWNIYVGLDIGSIYEGKEDIINDFHLYNNYPNPFNSSTQIQYVIKKPGHVQISIYNPLGKLIKKLVNQYQRAGTNKITWNGKGDNNISVPSGLYYYKITYGNMSTTKKMIILK